MYEITQQAERGRRRYVLTVVAVALSASALVAGGVFVGIRLGGSDRVTDPQLSAEHTDEESAATSEPSSRRSGSRAESKGQAVSLADLTWANWQGLMLPESPQYGPFEHDGDLVGRFSHDTGGALLAAIHITLRSQAYAGPDVYRPTIARQMTGEGADAYLASMESLYEAERLRTGLPPGSALPQPETRFLGWTAEVAGRDQVPIHLLIAQESADVQLCADVRLGMTWSGDDWQITAPTTGDGASLMSEVSCDATGYNPIPDPS